MICWHLKNPRGVRATHSTGQILNYTHTIYLFGQIEIPLHNCHWITLPTQSCLVLYTFCCNSRHLLCDCSFRLYHQVIIIIIIVVVVVVDNQQKIMGYADYRQKMVWPCQSKRKIFRDRVRKRELYTYIYIYIYRKRERERNRERERERKKQREREREKLGKYKGKIREREDERIFF